MEPYTGDTEESTEDLPGRSKSKLRTLKTRLFGRLKKTYEEGTSNLSQSASDITPGKTLGSEEDLTCSQGMLGSRALSHDSIFLADQVLSDPEPARVLSQENVHSKIKALQMKLQLQKMHLGPPPRVPSIKRPEDPGSRSGDNGLPHSPPEIPVGDATTQGAFSKATSQPSSRPLSPIPKPTPTRSVPPTPCLPAPALSTSTVTGPPSDFSTPAQFTPCLDTSAARHRMSVKPRNQRASTKTKRLITTGSRSPSDALNNIDHPEFKKEEEQRLPALEEITYLPSYPTQSLGTGQGGVNVSIASQCFPLKAPEPPQMASEPSVEQAPDLKEKRDDTLCKTGPTYKNPNREHSCKDVSDPSKQPSASLGSVVAFRSSVQQRAQGHTEATRGIQRQAPGSRSFHFSSISAKGQEDERPRSGSFLGTVDQAGTRWKTGGGADVKSFTSNVSQRGQMDRQEEDKLRNVQPQGGPAALGTPRDGEPLHKGSVLPWDSRDSLKKGQTATPSKQPAAVDRALEAGVLEDTQETVEEAVEATEMQEEEGKTAFGVKLRSTSLSLKYCSKAATAQSNPKVKHHSNIELSLLNPLLAPCNPPSTLPADQSDKRKATEESDDNASRMSKKLLTNMPCNPTTSGSLRQTASEAQVISSRPKEVETALSAPQEPQTTPQTAPQSAPQSAPSEVSWMSLAMEKTRSLQQLLTSRLPRDFTSMQAAARPQTQTQPINQEQSVVQSQTQKGMPPETQNGSQIQTQTIKQQQSSPQLQAAIQPSTEAIKPPIMQTASPAQTAKPSLSLATVQQKISTQSTSQHPTPQQPPWCNRGLQSATQPKPTPSAQASVCRSSPSATSAPAPDSGATALQGEGTSLSERRAVWHGSVCERSAFLEKRTDWSPGSKVELRRTQTEKRTPLESPALPITTPSNKDTKPEGRPGVKLAESSPIKVAGSPAEREDKWMRPPVASSSLPCSSPMPPSSLQSMSDSSQPSWMELAKRKSMAWSDKTMD
ncbi:uncharacterized protein cracdla [Polymixia lowei]